MHSWGLELRCIIRYYRYDWLTSKLWSLNVVEKIILLGVNPNCWGASYPDRLCPCMYRPVSVKTTCFFFHFKVDASKQRSVPLCTGRIGGGAIVYIEAMMWMSFIQSNIVCSMNTFTYLARSLSQPVNGQIQCVTPMLVLDVVLCCHWKSLISFELNTSTLDIKWAWLC